MPRVPQRIRKVALLVEWSRTYGRGVLRGIGQYVQAHGRWTIYHTERKLSEAAPSWLRKWQGDGIIARIESRKLAAQIRQLGLPAVDLFEHEDTGAIPAVLTDNETIARLAAEHLMERGLRQFAYCGLPGVYSSDERRRWFVRRLAGAGHEVHVYSPPRRRRGTLIAASEDYELQCEDALASWLRSLPKPVGLMACNDLRAHQVLMVCGDANLGVPEEVAVIGVDNDEVICGLSRPPLSSIEQSPEEVGYQAAALLDRLMQGDRWAGGKIVVEPRGVVARQSTDLVAVDDPDVAAALHYIREHACDGLTVDDVSEHVSLSRRTLERRFARLLDRSPRDEIVRVQLGNVKRLLSMTDYPLARIAQLTGFSYVESMCTLFKKTVGQTPGQYRREPRP
jgi:LacI family transcriptional regulator